MSRQSNQLLKELQTYLMGQLQSTAQAGETESPYLAALGKNALKYNDFLRGGDYNAPPPGTGLNMTPLATQERAAQLNNAPLAGGTTTAGQQPAGAYQLNHQDMQDKLASGYAGAKQQNIDQNAQGNEGALLGLGGLEQNRRTGAAHNVENMLGTYFSAIAGKRPSFLSSLLKGGIAAAPGILAAL